MIDIINVIINVILCKIGIHKWKIVYVYQDYAGRYVGKCNAVITSETKRCIYCSKWGKYKVVKARVK